MTRTAFFKGSAGSTILGAAAFAAFAAFAPPAFAQGCNPLTLLFGGCPQARVAPALPASEAMTPAPQSSGRLKPLRSASVDAPRRKARKPAPKPSDIRKTAKVSAPVGSLAAFAADPTLRSGDIVVTTEGFRVYRNNQFTAIAQDGGALAQLEKASMKPKTAAITEIVTTSGEKSGLVALRRAIRVASSQ